MKLKAAKSWIQAGVFLFCTTILQGQQINPVNDKEKRQIILKTIQLVKENYIYPPRADSLETWLLQKLESNGFSDKTNPVEFIHELNKDISNLCRDTHLRIYFGPDRVKQILRDQAGEKTESETISSEWMGRMKYENFSFRKLERLEGNIGYLEFFHFPPMTASRETIAAAMQFIRHSHAIILDLRENGGGSAETMYHLLGYFIPDSTIVGNWRYRSSNREEKIHIEKDPFIKKMPAETPICILVSGHTSSAAEGFARSMSQFRHALLIGEPTQGEANPGALFAINDDFYIMIPTIEAIDPVSRQPLDGKPLAPDPPIQSAKALISARLVLCKKLAESHPVVPLRSKYSLQIPLLEQELLPAMPDSVLFNSLVGIFEAGRKIEIQSGQLYYTNYKGVKSRLEYLGNRLFQQEGNREIRLLVPECKGPVDYFIWTWEDGGTEKVKRVR